MIFRKNKAASPTSLGQSTNNIRRGTSSLIIALSVIGAVAVVALIILVIVL